MNVANCARCGKIYVKVASSLCPDCVRQDEQMYELVYRYLRDHPRSTVAQVAAATEVPEDRILLFLREGRLQASEWVALTYPCERCGEPISNGVYCSSCAHEMQESLRGLAAQLQTAKAADGRRQGYHTEERWKRPKK